MKPASEVPYFPRWTLRTEGVIAPDERLPAGQTLALGLQHVVAMFGASALYHRFTWSPATRLWLRRLDHAGIFGLIAGTYTPFGLLVLEGYWEFLLLGIVWTGALAAIVFKFGWVDAPKWISAVIGVFRS